MEDQEWMTSKEAADLLKVSEAFLLRRRRKRLAPIWYKLGRAVRYKRQDLEDWLETTSPKLRP